MRKQVLITFKSKTEWVDMFFLFSFHSTHFVVVWMSWKRTHDNVVEKNEHKQKAAILSFKWYVYAIVKCELQNVEQIL
jgi:hypothetical protein